MAVNENEPVQCKDCKVWWRGLTHRCQEVVAKITSTTKPNPGWKDLKDKKTRKDYCPQCGAVGPHYCVGSRIWPDGYTRTEEMKCKHCGN